VHDSTQPCTTSLKCTNLACEGFMTNHTILSVPTCNFFHGDTSVNIMHKYIAKMGKLTCSRCKAEFKITHIEYGKEL